MNAGVERVRGLLIFLFDVALPDDTPEADLNVLAGAAEAIVEIKVPEGGIKIVTPHQTNRTLPEPNAFRARRRSNEETIGVNRLIGARTVFLDGFAFALLCGLLIHGLSMKRTRNERDRAEKNPYPKRNDTSHDLTARFSVTDDRKKKSLAKSRVPLRRFQHPEITLRQWRKSINLSSRELAVYHQRHELAKYWLITVAAATH